MAESFLARHVSLERQNLPIQARGFHLPLDLMIRIFKLLDLSSLMASQCVSKEWLIAASDVSIWHKIYVPRNITCRLWDRNFSTLVRKCQGELSELHVSGSGITGNAMISLLNATYKINVIHNLSFDHCSNLSAEDILNFLKTRSAILKKDIIVHNISINGCNLIGNIQMDELNRHVDNADVGLCICSRIQVLKKCDKELCKGLCSFCCEVFEDSGIECGLCSQPKNSRQFLRIRIHRWNLQIPDYRVYWRDVRHGLNTENNNPLLV